MGQVVVVGGSAPSAAVAGATTPPSRSTPCTWNTDFAMSNVIMVWQRILLGAGVAVLFVPLPAHAEVRIGAAGPLTGNMAWFGEQHERGVAMAVAEINQAGGLLGEPVEVVLADDYCDAEQGVAAARKLVADDVVFVAGHLCSGAAIPASALYQEAGIIMIAPTATNPKLTEQGFSNVFRVVNHDTEQARLAGDYLAEQWADAKIAILHDGTVYGRGLAEETRGQLNQRGVKEAQFGEIVPGQPEYSEMVAALEEAGRARPGGDPLSHLLWGSTLGAAEFHGRVRNLLCSLCMGEIGQP